MAWPCHSKASTWASYVTWKDENFDREDKEAIETETSILKFAKHYNIFSDCRDAAHAMQAERNAIKTAASEGGLPDTCFAVVWKNEDGTTERHMPMRNDVEITKAANYFHRYFTTFLTKTPHAYRAEVAERILEKAASVDLKLDGDSVDSLRRSAGLGMCIPSEAISRLQARDSVYKQSKISEARAVSEKFSELVASVVQKTSQLADVKFRFELAGIVDALDKAAGLESSLVTGDLSAPEHILFDIPFSRVKDAMASHASTITGGFYKIADIERLPLAQIRTMLGTEVAEAMSDDGLFISGTKASQVVPTLPRPDAKIFDQIMASNGYSQVAKSAEEVAISENILGELLRAAGGS